MSKELKADHERIWLQPKCCAGEYEGRQWCQDNVFDDGQCEDGAKATEYIRADLASRTPTEPGEAEVAKQLAAALTAIHEARLRKGSADKGYGWNITKLNKAMDAALPLLGKPVPPKPEINAAALRSTTPASDVVEAENYASEFVKGEAPADVSRAAVDDYALVERAELRKIIAELGYCTADASLEFMRLIPGEVAANRQSLQASIRVKDEALAGARLFVELVRIHWQNWHPDDEQQISEAESCVSEIDEALSQPIGGE